jgi:hypothetical protein
LKEAGHANCHATTESGHLYCDSIVSNSTDR